MLIKDSVNKIGYFQEHHHLVKNIFRRPVSVDNLKKVFCTILDSWILLVLFLYFGADRFFYKF